MRTSTLSALLYDSNFGRNDVFAALACRRVIEAKSGQNRMFDRGGSEGRLRAWSFLGTWRGLLCGEVMRFEGLDQAAAFLEEGWLEHQVVGERYANRFRRTYSGQSPFFSSAAGSKCHALEGSSRLSDVERHGAKSLTARNSAERLVASPIWNRENLRFLDTVYMASPSFFIDYKYGIPI